LRAYGSKSDAYAVFARMLASGQPPDSWDKLMAAVIDDEQARAAADRIRGIQADQ
jgi:toxin YhaV